MSSKGGKYCSNDCFLAVRWGKFSSARRSQKNIKCICLCGCGGTVPPSTVRKPAIFATMRCRGNKPHLVDQGIIPEYRKARIRGAGFLPPLIPQHTLKKCRNPACKNKVKNNIRHYCSLACSRKCKGTDLKLSIRAYAPEGYLSPSKRNFIYDKLIAGDRIALEVLRRLNVTRIYHNGINFDLVKGRRNCESR